MSEDLTRKGFLAAAAAAGVAALVPSVALANETQAPAPAPAEVSPLSALDVESVQGVGALAGSGWAEAAAIQTDVVKSHSALHIMNGPGIFGFSGWNTENDWPTDSGFGYSNNGFFVKGREVRLDVPEFYVNGSKLSSSTSGSWTVTNLPDGVTMCFGTVEFPVAIKEKYGSIYFYGVTQKIKFPIKFADTPVVTLNLQGYQLLGHRHANIYADGFEELIFNPGAVELAKYSAHIIVIGKV